MSRDPRRENQYIQLGLTIAYYRKLANMTQEELADAVQCSRTHLSNIEAPGRSEIPSLELLLKIADALNTPASRFLEFRDKK